MELEKSTLNSLIKYLKKHNYPAESFALNYKIAGKYIDLAIIDPDTKIPIIIFEIKSTKNEHSAEFGRKQLESYLKFMPDMSIPMYLVFPKDEPPFFEVQRIKYETEGTQEIKGTIAIESELDFLMQRQARVSEKIEHNYMERVETVTLFKWLCWILAVLVLGIGIIKKLKIINIDSTDLVLIGAFIGLILLPFVSRLKFLGIEFERFSVSKKK